MMDNQNTEGPAGTHGCACVHHDPRECLRARYHYQDDSNQRCECMCHQWHEDEDDAYTRDHDDSDRWDR